MMQKIENNEIITLRDARRLDIYRSKWFIFVITKNDLIDSYKSEGYVAYTFDTKREMYNHIAEDIKSLSYSYFHGLDAYDEEEDEISGIYYHN